MPGWLDSGPTLTAEQTRLVDVQLVGNYAVAPSWGDGHHTGYYTFDLLRDRCRAHVRARVPRPIVRPGVRMIVVTTPYLSGHRVVESKGMVFGLVVRSRGLSGNLMAGLRSLGGGEIHEYTSLLEDTRRQALDRLVSNATLVGANAVISMRFDSSEIAGYDERDRGLRDRGHRRAGRVGDDRRGVVAMGANLIRGVVARHADDRRRAGRDLDGRPGRGRRRLGAGHRTRAHRGRTARADALPIDPGRAVAGGARARRREPTDRPMEPRFRRTDQRFVDPTTHIPMVVWLNPKTGERRYRAEG